MINRRSTPTKDAVLTLLTGSRKAMSQDAIERQIGINIDRATIYRVLNRFVEDEIVHKIVADDGKQYFAVCVKCDNENIIPGNHFHFRCTVCETIQCMPTLVEFSTPKGFKVESMNCVLVGVCDECGK